MDMMVNNVKGWVLGLLKKLGLGSLWVTLRQGRFFLEHSAFQFAWRRIRRIGRRRVYVVGSDGRPHATSLSPADIGVAGGGGGGDGTSSATTAAVGPGGGGAAAVRGRWMDLEGDSVTAARIAAEASLARAAFEAKAASGRTWALMIAAIAVGAFLGLCICTLSAAVYLASLGPLTPLPVASSSPSLAPAAASIQPACWGGAEVVAAAGTAPLGEMATGGGGGTELSGNSSAMNALLLNLSGASLPSAIFDATSPSMQ